jgi:hypothetical protein
MTEAEWLACRDPMPMLELPGTQRSPRKRRLFVVACCRRIAGVMTEAGKRAVIAAEDYADGLIDRYELHDAWVSVGFPKAENRRYAAAVARAASVSPGNDLAAHGAASAVNASAKKRQERAAQADLLRDIFGNPFRPVALDPAWLTSDVLALAKGIYDEKAFDRTPILADALQDAGCDNDEVLAHCRDAQQVHVRGCWVVDLVLGKS